MIDPLTPSTPRFRPRAAAVAAAVILAASVLLAACAGGDSVPYSARPAEQIYNEAMDALQQKEYGDASRLFEEVERQHPYSQWATKAQIMAAYGYYQRNDYDGAIIALDRFIQLHPSNADVPYAYYLKALSYYEQISDVERDQNNTVQALRALNQIVDRYPNSRYARDAKLKLDLAYDHLGGKEMAIGRQYLKRRQYLAAINRFKRVVKDYGTTTHVPEALHRLIEAYLALGITEEAKKTAAVLGYNFPGSEWYMDTYELIEQKKVRSGSNEPWYKIW